MENGSLFQRVRQILKIEDDMDDEAKKEAASLIRNIFRYMDKDAKDIMTHRKNIVAIDEQFTMEEALEFMLDDKYSRVPIYHESIDDIIGFLHLREAMTCYLKEEKLRKVSVKELGDYIRPVVFIPETKGIDRLFKEMQMKKNHIAIVVDEYGQTSGLVTMEDIVEEIMGNILDEHDEEEELIHAQPDGSYLVDGMTVLEDLSDLLNISFQCEEDEEYDTLNGFLIGELERIPAEDEKCVIEKDGYRYTILSMDNNTIDRVKIEKTQQEC